MGYSRPVRSIHTSPTVGNYTISRLGNPQPPLFPLALHPTRRIISHHLPGSGSGSESGDEERDRCGELGSSMVFVVEMPLKGGVSLDIRRPTVSPGD